MNTRKRSQMTIAIPKGRLLAPIQQSFARSGIPCHFVDRELISYLPDRSIRFILVKHSDLATYVTHGIAGLGICGADLLMEGDYHLPRLMSFGFGKIRLSLISSQKDAGKAIGNSVLVATKFPRLARQYFHRRGIHVNIIYLNGSLELAPSLRLAPLLVDLVETGATLRDNNLVEREVIRHISTHLVANPAFYKSRYQEVDDFVNKIRENL